MPIEIHMMNSWYLRIAVIAGLSAVLPSLGSGQSRFSTRGIPSSSFTDDATSIPSAALIQPEELLRQLQGSTAARPLIIQVGSRVLFEEAHIPGSEYIGPASNSSGQEKLRQRLRSLPRKTLVVLYCGCCPWSHCPNVKPAWDVARSLGFWNVRVLYIADNFGSNWVDKGYPTAKGD